MMTMPTKRRKSPEQIVRLLGQADQMLVNGEDVAAVCRALGVFRVIVAPLAWSVWRDEI